MDYRTVSSKLHTAAFKANQEPAPKVEPSALELVLLRIRLRAQRRRLWLLELLRDENTKASAQPDYHSLIENILEGRDLTESEKAWQEKADVAQALNTEIAWVEERISADKTSRLAGLILSFGLSYEETAIFHTCLALAIDPQLESVCSYLQDNNARSYVSFPLVSKLFGLPFQLNHTAMPILKAWDFVTVVEYAKTEPAILKLDPWICNWILGSNGLDPILVGRVSFPAAKPSLENWPVDAVEEQIKRILDFNRFQKVRLAIEGLEGSGRRTFATHIAALFGRRLMTVNVEGIEADEWDAIYMHAQRQAYLDGFSIAWHGENLPEIHWPKDIYPVQLQFAAIDKGQVLQSETDVIDIKTSLKPLSIGMRRDLWQTLVPVCQDWPKDEFEELVKRYACTPSQISLIGQRAAESPSAAIEILREANRHRLGKLAQRLPSTFTWEDVSLHPHLLESLQDFVFEAKEREVWWEGNAATRLFPQGKGLMAMFSGSSGTGKTMTAQVIAASLQLDLFRIDLSSVISKYIGETSKHIDRILAQAQSMHAVLLFDEADTLFGKRTDIKDAHDRFANSDTNYLLQAIENYPGIAILATNKKANIDGAFLRRLRFVFEFNKPDATQRLQLWTKLLDEIEGEGTALKMKEPLGQIASLVELTGAQIKYALLSTVFIARRQGKPLGIAQLLKGIERELSKEGRGLSPETRKRLNYFKR